MGDELACEVRKGRRRFTAKVLLETDEVIVRGPEGFHLPFTAVTAAEIVDGSLSLHTAEGSIAFALGERAARWQEKIRAPKGLLEKLGVKPALRVQLVGKLPSAFRADLAKRGANLVRGARCDLIFLAAEDRLSLEQLPQLKGRLAPNGALWVVRPKGSEAITEKEVFAAGKAAGLVDIKVVRFSETHTADKFVIPLKDRR
jgi:hypothetical protein